MNPRLRLALTATLVSLLASACGTGLRAAVSLSVVRVHRAPADASVTIDEEYIGPLAYVAAHGVRLPLGEHRISVERDGYFPFDRIIVAKGSDPIRLDVTLERIPD